jgi:hypothetical protein
MSQVGKLNMVNAKLGATMPGQQTTRYIFDTVTASAAGATQYNFFQTFAGKTDLQTNLTTNKLDSSESMVIKSIFLAVNSGTEGTLTATGHMNLNVIVGNQVVLKDFDPSFNSSNRGLAFDRLHSSAPSAAFRDKIVEIRLLTDIVIPPQVNFKATLELAETTSVEDTSITLGLKGYGTIFSAGSTF